MLRVAMALAGILCGAAGPLLAGDAQLAPQLAWRLPYGGAGTVGTPALGLTVRLADDALGLGAEIVALDLDADGAGLTLAGLPLSSGARALAQNDASALGRPSAPWYTRPWVLWTAGGLAATVALSGGGGGDQNIVRNCSGDCDSDEQVTGVGDDGAVCTGDQCVVCKDGSIQSSCPEFTGRQRIDVQGSHVRHDGWLDAGTGRMGDLFAQ